ncbi:diguanylate cyclase [Muricoccus aerilatus]|uniref:diguanylate cyclase n=1 Tax=Muricoccus aerilatus TaxID=452982 RepID=UPI0006942A0D|nr:diguanylate cyclase [Roseomonas aerilata]
MQNANVRNDAVSAAGYHRSAGSAWLVGLGAVVALGVIIVGVLTLLDSRVDVWRQAEQASENLVRALDRDISRTFATYDLSLQGAIQALSRPDLSAASDEIQHMALFDRAASADYLGSLLVLGPDGKVRAASTSTVPPALDLSDREYFHIHHERSDAGLFVSRPFLSRLRDGDPSLAISRRIDGARGEFVGVVVGTTRLAYFQDNLRTLDLGPQGSITLLRSDGRVLARNPLRGDDIDRDLSGTENVERFIGAQFGSFVGKAALDGVERLYTFRHVDGLPLVLSVAVAVEDILAPWRYKALIFGSMHLMLCIALLGLFILFRRELRRRAEAERQLSTQAKDLAKIARADGLTGFANRRCLDEVLARECSRAAREQTPVSLLLLDLDKFKAFNDHYGHPAGDACLRAVAQAVGGAVSRPGDLTARYGGEELAVVLPNTTEHGARHIADQILTAVEALGLEHEHNAAGIVTVSIGCAAAIVTPNAVQSGLQSLLAAADKALYEAKRQGRNRVVSSEEMPTSPVPPAMPAEEQRLVEVALYKERTVLPTEGLDRIARLTARLLGAPAGMVTLVDADEQLLIGRHGVDVERTPREIAFCAHTITGTAPLIVPDAMADPRFCDNPLVRAEPSIRFYAGAPLVAPENGAPLGALCIVDSVPRAGLDAAQRALLVDLAELTMQELERMRTGAAGLSLTSWTRQLSAHGDTRETPRPGGLTEP